MNNATKRPGLSSQARNAILAQHDHLRHLTTELSELARLAATSEQAVEPLRAKARTLYTELEEHMRFEESALETALRDVVGRGAELHAEIEHDHQIQRAILASALAELGTSLPGEELVRSIRRFVDLLLRDMDAEEEILLNADVDALLVDSEGG